MPKEVGGWSFVYFTRFTAYYHEISLSKTNLSYWVKVGDTISLVLRDTYETEEKQMAEDKFGLSIDHRAKFSFIGNKPALVIPNFVPQSFKFELNLKAALAKKGLSFDKFAFEVRIFLYQRSLYNKIIFCLV